MTWAAIATSRPLIAVLVVAAGKVGQLKPDTA